MLLKLIFFVRLIKDNLLSAVINYQIIVKERFFTRTGYLKAHYVKLCILQLIKYIFVIKQNKRSQTLRNLLK